MRRILYSVFVVFMICLQSTPSRAQVTLAEMIDADPRLEAFARLAATIPETLRLAEPGNYTVFAFTSKAFNSLPRKERLILQGPNQAKRRKLIAYHIHNKAGLTQNRIPNGSTFLRTMLRGERFCIRKTNNRIYITDGLGRRATITSTKQRAANGVLHVIDKVLTPGTPNACR